MYVGPLLFETVFFHGSQTWDHQSSWDTSATIFSSCHLKDPSQFILRNKLKINKPQSTAKLPTWKQIRGIPPGWERASGRWRTHTGKQDSLGQPQVQASRKIFDYLLLTQNRFIKLKSAAKISLLYGNYTSVKLFFKKKKEISLGGRGGNAHWNANSFGIQGYSSLTISCRAHTDQCGQQ